MASGEKIPSDERILSFAILGSAVDYLSDGQTPSFFPRSSLLPAGSERSRIPKVSEFDSAIGEQSSHDLSMIQRADCLAVDKSGFNLE